MKVIGEFSDDSQRTSLLVNGCIFAATWESDPGYVEVPGLSEFRVRVDDATGQDVVYMRWLVADIQQTGGQDHVLEALESHSLEGHDWAACMQRNKDDCPPWIAKVKAIALLSLIAATPEFQGRGMGTALARHFAETVLAPLGVGAFWIKPVPLMEHPDTGIFKPKHTIDSASFRQATARLEKHYETSLDAEWTCPDYLRVDLVGADEPPTR